MGLNKIALLGGSFDPIHLAHLALAQTAYDTLDLDQVQLLPAACPWQRFPLQASADHRRAMIERAINHHPHFILNPQELYRPGPTYTIDTLRALPNGPRYFWLLGADQLANFCTWHNWEELVERIQLVVAARPDIDLTPPLSLTKKLNAMDCHLIYLPFIPTTISSTLIRNRIMQNLSTEDLLPFEVSCYIEQHHLYRFTMPQTTGNS